MKQIGSLLWSHASPIQIFGANTGVGKTVATTALLRSNLLGRPLYIKPVSTGAEADNDCLHIQRYVPQAVPRTLLSFDAPVSPHLAAKYSKKPHDDNTILTALHDELVKLANSTKDRIWPIVECAGGVLSPGPSGTPQADLYRPLRLPVLLVGDHRLGGIGTTISAWESLHLRGYDVLGIMVFQDRIFENSQYIKDYFQNRGIPVAALPEPPPLSSDKALDAFCMQRYYDQVSTDAELRKLTESVIDQAKSRWKRLTGLPLATENDIWHPFLQHTERKRQSILAIDSAYGDYFQVLRQQQSLPDGTKSTLVPAFDGSASWWTQGLGHGNSDLALTAAYAAGRYGHVMFANAAHEPAVALARQLKAGHKKDAKVFYTDNGSTGMEVAVKMALKAAAKRYGWQPSDNIKVLGLKGSYHGDTIGVMDCSEGNVYNEKVEWYKARGAWFGFPKVTMSRGVWKVVPPETARDEFGGVKEFENLSDIFDFEQRKGAVEHYRSIIDPVLKDLVAKGNKFGALIMEPVILGAGGMLFADPMFQYAFWQATQRLDQGPVVNEAKQPYEWTGMPLVSDEVFTGMFRLGRFSSSRMINVTPDVSVHAKLLTGGLIPLAATVARGSIFEAFLSDDKADALLHGHSYTAHAMGCTVALESLRKYKAMNHPEGSWMSFKQDWSDEQRAHQQATISTQNTDVPRTSSGGLQMSWPVDETIEEDSGEELSGAEPVEELSSSEPHMWSMWAADFTTRLSFRDDVQGVFALGSVLAVEMSDPEGAGYTSTVSLGVRDRLMIGRSDLNQAVHCRVLGNVLYFMCSLTSTRQTLDAVQEQIEAALDGK